MNTQLFWDDTASLRVLRPAFRRIVVPSTSGSSSDCLTMKMTALQNVEGFTPGKESSVQQGAGWTPSFSTIGVDWGVGAKVAMSITNFILQRTHIWKMGKIVPINASFSFSFFCLFLICYYSIQWPNKIFVGWKNIGGGHFVPLAPPPKLRLCCLHLKTSKLM
jgi:hypothetical protein